ncbi:CPBP family intramembrane glutamic endopeptidase, partial [Nitrospirillum viridazoti]
CAVVVVAVASRERGRLPPAVFGDVEVLLPRDGAERAWAAVLSLNAGLTEEATFRLLLPLLITLAVGDAPLGMAASALVFGLAHLYLGWRGVAATTIAGMFLSLVYLAAGNLLVPIAVHVATDWVGLLVLPRLVEWRRPGQP